MKDFDSWNNEKKNLEKIGHESLPFHEREIWWCSIGINLGDEQDGKNELFERTILVIKKFNNKIAWVLPMTTKDKEGEYYYKIKYDGRAFNVILSQLRLTSVKRFHRLVRKISPKQFNEIKERLIGFLSENRRSP